MYRGCWYHRAMQEVIPVYEESIPIPGTGWTWHPADHCCLDCAGVVGDAHQVFAQWRLISLDNPYT